MKLAAAALRDNILGYDLYKTLRSGWTSASTSEEDSGGGSALHSLWYDGFVAWNYGPLGFAFIGFLAYHEALSKKLATAAGINESWSLEFKAL
ncbi:hypothetical protein Tco_1156766 [Tanacetum coccineum]